MKKKIVHLSLVLLVVISFLFSGPPDPKGPNSYCPHQYVRLNRFMGVPVNCDELVFIGAAAHPSLLMVQNFQRQGRPAYILLGTALGYSIYYTTYPLHTSLKTYFSTRLSGQFSVAELDKAVLYGAIYAGFILVNFTILFLTLVLFEKCIQMASGDWKNKPWLLWLCMVMLLSNQVTKIFFWTAHQQMFTMFTPVACLYAGLSVMSNRNGHRWPVILSFIAGLLLLVYGNFILLLPVIIFSQLLKLKEQQKLKTRSAFFITAAITAVFLLPTVSWMACLRFSGITYYNHEVSYWREFVWITDALGHSIGTLLTALVHNSLQFFKTTGSLIFPLLFSLALLFACLPGKKNPERKIYGPLRVQPLLAIPFVLFCVFLWLMGYYTDRLTLSLAPFMLFAGALYINERNPGSRAQAAIAVLATLIHLYFVFFNAPHFSDELFYQ